ncbi:probable glyoxylate-induced protein [Coraliomargarita sp. CAG:312]|nr:probable glyoxylate-induced protein [Coraliomargarita sp. CAG:312]
MMNRRTFTKTAMTAMLGAVATKGAIAHMKPTDIAESTAPYKCKFSPNLGQCTASTKGLSEVDKIKFFYDCGFRGLEDNGMPGRPVEIQNAMAKQMEKLGMEMGVFVAHAEWGCASMAGNRLDMKKRSRDKKAVREFWKGKMEAAVELAKRVNAKWCTVVPGLEDPTLEPEYQFANVVEHLKYASEILEKSGLIMVLEPLNILNHPSLYLKRIPQAYAICKAVNSPSCKILDDLYHQQITEGNLIPNMDAAWDEIAYIQVGDVPGRKEPTTGEINYKNVFQYLWDKGYRGIIGMEHGQSDKTIEGDKKLLKAYRSVDVA